MTIKPGDKLPEGKFSFIGDNGPEQVSTSDYFAGKKIVMFAVPGAFTPTCHNNHLPGFLENLGAITQMGVDDVAVLSVNDLHVMNAWAEATGGKGKIRYFADGSAEFTKAIGLDIDLTAAGLGIRSTRYSMIVDDGVVTALNIEEMPGKAEASGAAAILEQLQDQGATAA